MSSIWVGDLRRPLQAYDVHDESFRLRNVIQGDPCVMGRFLEKVQTQNPLDTMYCYYCVAPNVCDGKITPDGLITDFT